MSHRVRLHPAVRSDLATIAHLIAEYAGHTAAKRKLQEIGRALRSLEETPHRGTIRDEIAPGLRAIPAARHAVVVFRVDDAVREVFVYAVTYGGADWISRTKKRS